MKDTRIIFKTYRGKCHKPINQPKKHHPINIFLISLWFVLLLSPQAFSAKAISRPDVSKTAEIVAVKGESDVFFVDEKRWYPAVINQILTTGDTLRTGINARLDVLFSEGMQIKIHQKTTLIIKEHSRHKKVTVLNLKVGEVWSKVKTVPKGD